MAYKYSSLEELKRKKALLKKDISDMEAVLTFDNTKESLSALTHGFTDKYLQEDASLDGSSSISLNKNEIVKEISNHVKDSFFNRNAVLGFAKSEAGLNIFQNTLKIGAVTFIGNFARKSIQNKSWKKKLIGLALIYIAPFALRFIKKKIEEYQNSQTTSSFEQLI